MSRIDVVVPCYNYGAFLRECVDSVTRQSHRDLRVLIIDDASTDETPSVAAAIAAEDDRVEVQRHATNHGHIDTYNEGITWAEGHYWLLLSADDFLLPGAIERAVGALDAYRDLGLIYGAFAQFSSRESLPYQIWRPSGSLDPVATLPAEPVASREVHLWGAAALIDRLIVGNHIAVATAVARVDVQRKIGPYRNDLKHAGDLEMWLRFALQSKVGYIDSLQAVYRQHDQNMSTGYLGYRDFRQRVRAFDLHMDEIRGLAPNGGELVRQINRRHAIKATKWAARSLLGGRFKQLKELCGYAMRTKPFAESDLV